MSALRNSHDGTTPPRPCPFCGRGIAGDPPCCPSCQLPLDERTRRSLERLTGPWFVLTEATPSAPGVSWRKFCQLIAKGKIRPGSVVRGPGTRGLWRRACDTPSVATRLGLCWSCHAPLPPDRTRTDCPECGSDLNGPLDWPAARAPKPDARAAPAPEPTEPPSPLDDLIQAAADGAGANGPPPEPDAPGRFPRAVLVALAAVGSLAAGLGWAFFHFSGDGDREGEGEPARLPRPAAPDRTARRPRAPAPGSLPPARLPPGPLPGELFPDVPEYVPPPATAAATQTRPAATSPDERLAEQRRRAAEMFAQALAAEKAGELMKAQDLLVRLINDHDVRAHPAGALARLRAVQDRIRAAAGPGPSPEDLARQKRTARILWDTVVALEGRGDLVGAQSILVRLLNSHHRAAWPDGAVRKLGEIQAKIRASTRPADDISDAELARQKASAGRLFARAQRLMGEGNYVEAQKPLLAILNDHHPRAWPAGALEAFQKIQDAFRRADPTTVPSFFDIKAKK